MSTEKMAKCLGELQRLLPKIEDNALRQDVEKHIDLVLRKMFAYCVQKGKAKVSSGYQSRKHVKQQGPSLADAGVRALNQDKNLF